MAARRRSRSVVRRPDARNGRPRPSMTSSNVRAVLKSSGPLRNSSIASVSATGQSHLRSAPNRAATPLAFNRAFAVEDLHERSTPQAEDPLDEFSAASEVLREIVMAVNVTERGSVGCAYYVARDEKLYFMEDVQLGGAKIVDSLKLFIDPTVVLISTKCNDEIVDCLDPEGRNERLSDDGRSTDQTRLPYLLEHRPNAEFAYEGARNKLLSLRIGHEGDPAVTFIVPGDVTTHEDNSTGNDFSSDGQQGQLLRISGWINLESRLTVGCAGAVLTYLHRRRAIAYLPGDHDAETMFRISTIEMFTLKDSMFVNTDTTLSLQITSAESHPNSHQQGPSSSSNRSGGQKEGLSVYGLFHNLAKTQQGRTLLRKYFLRPSLNLDVINERLDTISILSRTENIDVLSRLTTTLAKVRNMRVAIVSLRKGSTVGLDKVRGTSIYIWQSLRQFLFSALSLVDLLNELHGGQQLAIRSKIIEKFDRRQLAHIGQLLSQTIDFDNLRDGRRCIIQPGVDEELDEIQQTYDGIEQMLGQVVNHVADHVPAELGSSLSVIFFPQIGFLVAVQHEDPTLQETYSGTEEDPWEKMFATEKHVYYKNSNMTEMDEHFGDIYGRIRDKEIEILQHLAHRVLEHESLLSTTSDICGELDCLVALARGANQYNLVRPHMTEENIIDVKGGRHPLQELTVSSFVPNDTFLIGGHGGHLEKLNKCLTPGAVGARPAQDVSREGPSMMLMTGPNYSGKSVYLKQVAIIVYMAHVGCFVPAEAARIGLTDKIITRIATRESVSRAQSAFMIDLQQTSMALSLATRRSLIVVDEFGKGTESYDGAGLATGVFEHLLSRGSECPKVLGATHYHEIFECGFLRPRPALAYAHMEVRMDKQASDVDDQITYLYNLCPGRSISSFGTCCAAINGIPREVIGRAEQLIQLAGKGEDLVEACAELPDAEMAELENAEQMARDFLAFDRFNNPRRLLDDLVTLTSSTIAGS